MLTRIAIAVLVLACLGATFTPGVQAHTCRAPPPWVYDIDCGPCDPSIIEGHDHYDYHGHNCQSDPCAPTDVLCVYEVVRDMITTPGLRILAFN